VENFANGELMVVGKTPFESTMAYMLFKCGVSCKLIFPHKRWQKAEYIVKYLGRIKSLTQICYDGIFQSEQNNVFLSFFRYLNETFN